MKIQVVFIANFADWCGLVIMHARVSGRVLVNSAPMNFQVMTHSTFAIQLIKIDAALTLQVIQLLRLFLGLANEFLDAIVRLPILQLIWLVSHFTCLTEFFGVDTIIHMFFKVAFEYFLTAIQRTRVFFELALILMS